MTQTVMKNRQTTWLFILLLCVAGGWFLAYRSHVLKVKTPDGFNRYQQVCLAPEQYDQAVEGAHARHPRDSAGKRLY
jgi:hypothetical protein